MKVGVAVPLVILASATAAHAQPKAWWITSDDAPLPSAAITISPLHLQYPIIELTGEFRVGTNVGIAVMAGAGEVTFDDIDYRYYEGGTSFRYYWLGNFRQGAQIGAEIDYISQSSENTTFTAAGAGLDISVFGGYKWTHRSGFTLDGQAGISYLATGESKRDFAGLLNLNVGWSI